MKLINNILDQNKNEIIIAFCFLVIYISFLMIISAIEYSSLIIIIIVYIFSWIVVSFSIKHYSAGFQDKNAIQKELIWFGAILIVFLIIITIVTQEDGGLSLTNYAIISAAFTITWIVRSILIKYFKAKDS